MNNLKMKLENLSKIDMSVGKPVKQIILFAIPLMLGNLFQMFYSMVDTMVVGKYVSTVALAAVGATTPVVDLLLGLIIGLSNGLSIVIAQKIGAGNKKGTTKAVTNGFYLIIVLGIIILISGLMFNRSLFNLIHVSEELLPGAMTYSSIIFMGAIFSAIYNYESALLRAHGNSIVPLMFLILSAVLNIVLDLFFVLVLHMGIAGVALSTILAQLICCILCFLYMERKMDILHLEKSDYIFDITYIKEHIRVGMPMAFFQSLLSVSFLVVQSALNTLGSNEVAAYTAAYKMDSMMMSILSGFGTAISTFTALNYGNRSFERIKQGARDTLKITITLSIIVAVMAHFFSSQFMSLFVNEQETEVIGLGIQYISFTSLCYFILGINFIVRFVLTGLGQSFVPLSVGILEIIVRCLGTYFLIYPLGFQGMIYINPLCWGTSTLLIVLVYPFLFKRAMGKSVFRSSAEKN